MEIFPANRQRLVHLQILTSLHAATAKNALTRVITIERIGIVYREWLRLEWPVLMLDLHQRRRIVNRTVLVIVIANRTVKFVISQDHVHGGQPRSVRARGIDGYLAAAVRLHFAGTNQFAIRLDDARVACPNWTQLRMKTNLRKCFAGAIDEVKQQIAGGCLKRNAVDCQTHLPATIHHAHRTRVILTFPQVPTGHNREVR